MKILHGTWIPQSNTEFRVGGGFFLWGETDTVLKGLKKVKENRHPRQLVALFKRR